MRLAEKRDIRHTLKPRERINSVCRAQAVRNCQWAWIIVYRMVLFMFAEMCRIFLALVGEDTGSIE